MRNRLLAGLTLGLSSPAAATLVLPGAPTGSVVGTAAVVAVLALVTAVARLSWVGTLTVAVVPVAAAVSEVLSHRPAGTARLVGAAVLLLVALAALDRLEESRWGGQDRAGAASPWRRAAPFSMALLGTALVALVAAQSVVPSWGLALLGMAAAATAVALATAGHRPDPPPR